MTTLFTLQPYYLKELYNSLSFHKTKDKTHMVLEPLQSMIQLALLSISPLGTKLTIQENILYLQTPSLIQPVSRWYYSDKKDDLFYLFQVIKRFIKWYNPKNSEKSPINQELYDILIKMSIDGLNKLSATYNSSTTNTVFQVINMYISLLENNDSIDSYKMEKLDKINIDEVFEKIILIYDSPIINIIYNTLLLVKQETNYENINNIILGFNLIMNKSNKQIQQWINNNLIL